MIRHQSTVVSLKPVPRTAEEWCARMHADDVSPQSADHAALQTWLAADPSHRADYELCELVFAMARNLGSGLSDIGSPPGLAGHRSRLRWVLGAGMAASIVMAGLLALWWSRPPAFTTRVGEQRLVALADGSTVQLNTASAIAVELGATERRVTLRQGEAFFSVKPDPRRPFIVRAGSSIIRVVGTRFDVRVEGDNATVTVVQGLVELTTPMKPAGSKPPPRLDLRPGEGASLAVAKAPQRWEVPDTSHVASWREGKIYFDGDPLGKVIAEMNRYSPDQFVLADPGLERLTLSGVFRTADTDAVVFALHEAYGLSADRDSHRIFLRAAND